MSSSTYDARSRSIGELIGQYSNERLVVPEFQRGYSWKKKEIEALWDDIERFEKDSSQKKYFLGPIVTRLSEEEGILHLLDGQQRLATTIIFLSVLRDLAPDTNDGNRFAEEIQAQLIKKENGEFSLQMGETDSVYFRDTIQEFPARPRKATLRTHVQIRNARKFLFDKLTALTAGTTDQARLIILRSKRSVLSKDLVLTNIPVASEEDAFQIFETLNARGLRLAPPDLLLNYLMREAKPTSDRPLIRELWTEMVEQMGRRDIFKFLRALWVSKYGDLKKENLFVALKQRIEERGINCLDFARSCAEECQKYNDLYKFDSSLIGGGAPFVRVLLQQLGKEPAMPLLLSSFNQKVTASEFEKVCRYALIFVTRHSVLTDRSGTELEDVFYAVARDVRKLVDSTPDGQKATIARTVKEKLVSNSPSDAAIESALNELVLEHDEAMYVVSRIATHLQTDTKEVAMGEANLEHVYPRSPKSNEWGGEDGQKSLNPYLWHIGNLTWLGERINAQGARNEEYSTKRAKYLRASELVITQELAKAFTEWNEHTIVERASKLKEAVLEIWKFDNPSRV